MKALSQLLTLTAFLAGSYATFHGHRLHKDCLLCNYRGLGWITSVGVIIYADYLEKQNSIQENQQSTHYSYPMHDYSRHDNVWENTSEAGSDDSNDTIKGTKTN